ncbi:tata box-binding protein-associated factor RNA polymerase i subunit b [Phtheirospermum japonicum]|uniref:Tata box-binding protein-associated factor RNA polymerase i subunit b n=1 Tax=Phtheirospermum japonicum TaxID=374723 RepID=A0A830BIC1_9LAMI|nr:tata box-binding protein-associated factor RNA polymerase i subunit b [Phtheirospermum japonicum]
MVGRVQRTCQDCGSNVGFSMSDDGFFYCGYCLSQADDIVDTGVDEEQVFTHYNPNVPVDDAGDGVGPTGPSDFGSTKKNISYEDYYLEIRSRYLTGIQIMIQSQCKALVEEFSVSPLIIGLVGQVWLRFLASTGLMAGEWADQAVHDSEAQMKGAGEGEEFQPSAQHRGDPVNIHGKRVAYVWFRSLRSTIQLPCTLAISFLVCHVAREAVTPSDMIKWALEGKLPYFAASDDIEKQIGSSSDACPIPAKRMFRPVKIISSQKLESTAAQIAQKIGLELPSVNFFAIASRFLNQLSLPIADILSMACRVHEWSKPTELYLSANEFRIPTRACVMSILIVTIRMIFDINGYGMWESSFSNNIKNVNLLRMLEAKYDEFDELYAEYSCDLPSYLQFCKDVVFSDLRPSYEDLEEEKILKEFWDFYQSNKVLWS